MSKKIISVFLIFAISLSMFALPVHAAEGEPTIGSLTGSFWQMLVSSSTDFVQYLFGTVSNIFNADAICPTSPDAKHHPGRVGAGRLSNEVTVWCEYCNEPCSVDDSVLEDAYQDYVEDLPPGLNSSSSGVTVWASGFDYSTTSWDKGIAFWKTIDIYSLFNSSDEGELLTAVSRLATDSTDKYYFLQLGEKTYKDSTYKIIRPGYTVSLAPYTNINFPLGSLVSFSSAVGGSSKYPIFCNYEDAFSYYSQGGGEVYFLQPSTYISFPTSSTGNRQVPCFFYDIGHISSTGSVSTVDLTTPSLITTSQVTGQSGFYSYALYPLEKDFSGMDSGSRPGSVAGNFGTMGDNGTVNNIGNQVIVNESDGTFYNPETGEYQTMESWQYDYATRTYNIVTGDGQMVTVTYGNENLTINNGDVTYNIYYMYEPADTSNGGGSGSGSGDSSGGGIFDKIGELLGTLGGGLVDAVGKVVEFLLDSLLRLARVVVDKGIQLVDLILSFFERIPDMFGAFPQFLAAVFPFIPEEVMIILEFGLAAVVILGIFKILRK